MNKLSPEQISKYASRAKVRKIAVENFLMSLSGNKQNDMSNVDLDARLYQWNVPTQNAIRAGIKEAYSAANQR